jgi:hypothetical protein
LLSANRIGLSLETAARREKDVSVIGVHSEFRQRVATLLGVRHFRNLQGASITRTYLRDPSAVSRFINVAIVFLSDPFGMAILG